MGQREGQIDPLLETIYLALRSIAGIQAIQDAADPRHHPAAFNGKVKDVAQIAADQLRETFGEDLAALGRLKTNRDWLRLLAQQQRVRKLADQARK